MEKVRGKKPYNRIKIIYAEAGGFTGPFLNIIIDLESGMAINSSRLEINPKDTRTIQSIAKEYIEWFPSELYTCDFVNWAEEYIHLFVLN